MKLVIGLGNPGKEYDGTRHNVGRDFASYAQGHTTEVFMNNSGLAVRKLLEQKKLTPEDLIIVHDDLDIEFGKFKISFNRNAAGHHGIESIIASLKTKAFWRLRIGTASPRLRSARIAGKVSDFVLSKFTSTERHELTAIFQKALAELQDRFPHA